MTEFPTTATNPNGVWTYGWKSTTTGAFTAFTTDQFYDNSISHGWNGGNDLSVYHPESDQSIGSVILDDDFLNLHPNPGGTIPVVRWTAPSLDVYTIAFLFKAHDFTPSGTGLNVVINNAIDWSDSFAPGDGQETRGTTLIRALAAGSTVDFQIDYQGNYTFDSTGLQGIIDASSAVPEPSTIALMAGGLLAFALRRRMA